MDSPSKADPLNPERVKTIFIWLVVLTAIEVGISYLPLQKSVIAVLLIESAIGKAALVALFFMHLKYEGKLLYSVAVTPLVLAFLFLAFIYPDTVLAPLAR